jgi:anaerobic selenocysteine-containing dehydrogenase
VSSDSSDSSGVKRSNSTVGDILLQREGVLTRELVREPGGFGLGQVPSRLKPDATTSMPCGYCSTGCGLKVHLKDGEAINLSPDTAYPVNLGMACPKGWEALTPLKASDRATQPLLRNKAGKLVKTDWGTALGTFTERFKAIQAKHGNESVAFISTGQIPIEEMALLGALAKFGMGMVHGDGNTRQCMATAVAAYKQAFGFDAPPYTYKDFEESDVLFFVGANPAIAHPIMWERVAKNKHKPTVVVVDPRRTETAMAAQVHVPLKPKSDLSLFYGIANLLIKNGWIDREYIDAHVTGFQEFAKHVEAFPAEHVARETGISQKQLKELAELIRGGKRVSFWWTMGVNQSHEGVRLAQALINLALITGNVGRPGTGANSITGQCNAMGSRLFSNTTNLLGGRDFENEAHRKEVAAVLDIPFDSIPDQNSLAYDQIIEGILQGKIKGLWIIATNPSHSWINHGDLDEILGHLDFLVVQDMYDNTVTAKKADLLLPAAGWGEKEGVFINSERRLAALKRVSKAPGEALADFYIFKLIAEAWGCGGLFERWSSPEVVFGLLKELSEGMPCDISGIGDYRMLDEQRGIQWPLRKDEHVEPGSERRLFADGNFFHPDGKAKLLFADPRPPPEGTDKRYPFLLMTGRGSSAQWHTQTRTGKSAVLNKLSPQTPYVEISPLDAEDLEIDPNDWVEIESRRGKMRARAFVTHVVQPGQVFIPMHFADANRLTFPAFDPYSRQPSYKASAVRLKPVNEFA